MSAEVELDERVSVIAEVPKKWSVFLVNDNTTTIDFVVSVLMDIFNHDEETAVGITYDIHHNGQGLAGIYNFEIAEAKAVETTSRARSNGFPLQTKLAEAWTKGHI